MMRRISNTLAFFFVPAVLALGFSPRLHAQSPTLGIGVSPNPTGYDNSNTTVTGFVVDGDGSTPTGTIDFFISTNNDTCVYSLNNDLGSQSVSGSGDIAFADLTFTPTQTGSVPICANYSLGDAGIIASTGPIVLTVYGPATLTTFAAPQPVWSSPLNFTLYFVLTYAAGQNQPQNSTITLYDDVGNQVGSPVPVGTITLADGVTQAVGAVIQNPNFTDLTNPGTYNYSAAFTSGDPAYVSQSANGSLYFVNPLTSVVPASVMAGPVLSNSDTACTSVNPTNGAQTPGLQVTLNGFDLVVNGTPDVAQINGTPLNTISSSSTQLTVCVPDTYLTSVGSVPININVSGSNPVSLQVSPPYAVTTTTSAGITSFAYGQSLASTQLTGTATRTSTSDGAVPDGSVNFSLNSTSASYSYSLGSGSLSQVSTSPLVPYQNPSATNPPYAGLIDSNQTQKMVAIDLNNDGFVDVVGLPGINPGSTAAGPYLQILMSTGSNGFQAEQQVYTGCTPQDFAVGDINGDGIPDLVVICSVSSVAGTSGTLQAYYLTGNGDGTFQTPVAFGVLSPVTTPTQVVIGWFNNDAVNDIAVIDGVNAEIQVISPFGSPYYGPETYFDNGYGPVVSAGVADFNQDGLSDIALEEYYSPNAPSDSDGTGAILVYTSNGAYSGFSWDGNAATFSASSYYLQGMTITSLLGDNWPDVAIADPGGAYNSQDVYDNGSIQVFENAWRSGSSDFVNSAPIATFQSTSVTNELSVAGPPFPLVNSPASNAAVAPGWNLVFSYPVAGDTSFIYVGELQFNSSESSLTMVPNPIDTGVQAYATEGGYQPGFIVAADLNGDGFLDYAATAYIPNGYLLQEELVPYYYGNDAQTSTTATDATPLNGSPQFPPPGNYTLNLAYPGNLLFQANSTSTTPATITIAPGAVTGTVSGPGSVGYGAALSLTANIYGLTGGLVPTGTVTFFDCTNPDSPTTLGSQGLASVETYAQATLNLPTQTLAAGNHNICIGFTTLDGNYNSSYPVNYTSLTVNGETLTLELSINGSTSSATAPAGSMVNFQVSGFNATSMGEIIYLSGLPFLNNPTATINSSGVASFNYGALPPGTYSVWAYYNGDSVYAGAQTGYTNLTVTPTPVTVNLTSSANPVTYPTPVTLTANATTFGLGVPPVTDSIAFDDAGSQLPSPSPVALMPVNGNSGLLARSTLNNPYAAVSGDTVIATVTGDFNHDGIPDIATLQTNSDSTAILVIALGSSNGDGTFQPPIIYGTTSGTNAVDSTSNSMAAADLTGSGYVDSLVIGASDGNIAILLYNSGNTAGVLNLSQSFASGYSNVVGVAAGELNLNPAEGFVVISANSVEAFLDNGNGTFPTTPYWTANSPYMYSDFTGIAIADFNGDGYTDIAISDDSGQNGPDVTVYLYNRGQGTFSAPVTYPVGVSATGIAAGNINSDAFPDLAVLSSADSTVDVLINDASGGFPTGTIYGVATSPTGIAIADFNGDGFADIAVTGNSTGAGSGTTVLLSSSTGVMTGETLLPTAGSSVAAADFNNDGNTDLAVGSNGVTIYLDSSAQAVDPPLVLNAGPQALTTVYMPASSSSFYGATYNTVSEVVNQAMPTIAWTPASITYGAALGASQLNAQAYYPSTTNPMTGVYTYSPPSGEPVTSDTQLSVTFTPTSEPNYQAVTQTVTVTVTKATPTISWATPTPITYGTTLSATQLNASATYNIGGSNVLVPGTYTYTPAAGTTLGAGSHTLSVTFAPTDTTDYATPPAATTTITVGQATPTITWSTPAAITYGTTLSATQLNATASTAGTFTYTPAAGTTLGAGSHTLSATFAPADTTDYATPPAATTTISVGQATPTITWIAPAAITYGTVLSTTQLDATASTGGTFTYTPAAGTTLTAGAHTLSVTFVPADTTDYANPPAATTTITVGQATPTITWTAPAAITYGTVLSATQLDATASTAGTFTYTPAAGTTLGAGSHALSVTFAPADTTDYATPPAATTTITVSQATPTVSWTAPAAITYGTALSTTQLNATASVPGTFSYSPAAGTLLTAGPHTLSATFTPTDTTDYAIPAAVTTTISVSQATPTITWAAPAAITYGTALSATQLNATAAFGGNTVPGIFTYTPASGTVLKAGNNQTLSVTFTPTDSTDYATPAVATTTISVGQATPTITWAAPAAITYGTALSATQLNATAAFGGNSVPGTFTYTPASGTVMKAGNNQTLSVTFTPTDTTDYASPAAATTTITVSQATPKITWAAPAAITYGTALSATQLNATAAVNGTTVPGIFTYTPASGTVLKAGNNQTLSVSFAPTDTTDYATPAAATTTITVSQATPKITWAAPAAITYGTALSAAQLNATATFGGNTVPGTFTYTPASGTVLKAGVGQTLSVTFTPTDTSDYAIPAAATTTITVSQASPTVTWTAPAAITYGTALSATQLNATAAFGGNPVPGTFAYTPASGTVLKAGIGQTLSVIFTPTDSTDFATPAAATTTITVNQATPTVAWTAPAAITYGTALSSAQLNATAAFNGTTVPGTFAYLPASGTVLKAGSSQTLSATFTPTDVTDYTTATGSVTIQVNQATPVITWPSPGNMSYGTPLGATQLNATATPSGGTFTYNPPAGTTLPIGAQTLSVTYVPTDTTDYATATATTTVNVIAGLSLASIAPTSAPYGSLATTITLTGLGFTQNSVAQLNGTAIPTTYTGPTQISAQIPASFFQQVSVGTITVFDTVRNLTTGPVTFTVTLPNLQITFSGPSTAAPGEQPTLSLIMSQPYPIDIQGTMTLTVEPLLPGGPTDPSVQFSTGGTTFNFTIPAGSTTTPTVQIQTGTISSTITVTLTLQANGQDIEPPSIVPITVTVPNAAPVITSVTLTRDGNTLTVNIDGYSSTRDMSNAIFEFTAAAGQSVNPPEINVDVSTEFNTWYSSDASAQYGSSFAYSQVFNLSNDASTIGSVSVVLTNSVGQSNEVTAQ
jgi:hypothetical protein